MEDLQHFTWESCVGFVECSGALLGQPWLRAILILLGVVVAVASVWSARHIARVKQSADLLMSSKSDKDLVDGLRCLSEIYNATDKNIKSFAESGQTDSAEGMSIRYVLNHWEHVSIGIQYKIYDEAMLHKASCNTVINLYKRARPFIERLRERVQRPTLYQEVEWLANRWEAKGAPKKAR